MLICYMTVDVVCIDNLASFLLISMSTTIVTSMLLSVSTSLSQNATPTIYLTQTVRVRGISCLDRTPGIVYCDHDAGVYAVCSAGEQAAPCMSLWPALEAFCQADMTVSPVSSTVVGPVSRSTIVVTILQGTTTAGTDR